MIVSKKELKRIAKICLLDFSDSEYANLRKSIRETGELEIIYQSTEYEAISDCAKIDTPHQMEIQVD